MTWIRSTLIQLGALLLMAPATALAVNTIVTGDMGSDFNYELRQQITGARGTKNMELRFVLPQSFSSPTYDQQIDKLSIDFSQDPSRRIETRDKRGNRIVKASWKRPADTVTATIRFKAYIHTKLALVNTRAPFPPRGYDREVAGYLNATAQVQVDNARIRELAVKLTSAARSEFDAVQRILTWVVDHLHYVNPPERYDALYALETGKGNCQNFSHLSAALMRAVGIPVRIVNGITLNRAFNIERTEGVLTVKMAQGRHSWTEVWFPDLGWVPFDPQQSQMFVPNRYIRVEIGADNQETINDGMLRWVPPPGNPVRPRLQESISANFADDRIVLKGKPQAYGPNNLLLSPQVASPFETVETAAPPTPAPIPEKTLSQMRYPLPFLFGNLSFPVDVDFAFPRGAVEKVTAGQMTRNFLVESAEYVTTRANQYAQAFVIDKPVKLRKIGLALHNFGGDGMLWTSLHRDRGNRPGDLIGTSELMPLADLSMRPGYRWADFDFSREHLLLGPGQYWIVLGFSGSPIVNWFYTYGKPVGPMEGTRYKGVFDDKWSGALSYEFNYRVMGMTVK